MEETVLLLSDNMRMYEREAPSELRVKTWLGRIMLTNQRFLFLSSGGNKLIEVISTKALPGGLLGGLVLGGSLTNTLNLNALDNEGSIDIPLERIRRCQTAWKFPMVWYLALGFSDEEGVVARSFMQDRGGFKPPVLAQIEQVVRDTKG